MAMASPIARHFRKHWKKYVFGNLALALGGTYLAKKFRDNNVIREYCEEAKRYGEKGAAVLDRPKKVTIFVNPMANKMNAKIQFLKYAAPLFHLSGMDVTIVESEYQGQIRTLMGYIDPDSDAIVVAGGDGTIMEVVNGLMRRWDVEKTRRIPIGILPLGKENRFYATFFSSRLSLSPSRRICEAAMNVIRGSTVPVHMLQLEPENGKTLYALSTIHWGAFRDSLESKDRFRLFGRFRLLISHVRIAVKGWPTDFSLRVWFPASTKFSSTDSTTGATPPSNQTSSRDSHLTSQTDTTSNSSKADTVRIPILRPLIAKCLQDKAVGSVDKNLYKDATSLSRIVSNLPGWRDKQFDVTGFKLDLDQGDDLEQGLKVVVWPATLTKQDFIKDGWSTSLKRPPQPLPGTVYISSPQLILQPHSPDPSWLSIDGETYEAMPLAVRVLPSVIRMFTRDEV